MIHRPCVSSALSLLVVFLAASSPCVLPLSTAMTSPTSCSRPLPTPPPAPHSSPMALHGRFRLASPPLACLYSPIQSPPSSRLTRTGSMPLSTFATRLTRCTVGSSSLSLLPAFPPCYPGSPPCMPRPLTFSSALTAPRHPLSTPVVASARVALWVPSSSPLACTRCFAAFSV